MTAEKAFTWRFVTPLFVGAALNPVNSSIIATALVPIARAMRVSVGSTTILVSALYLACTVAQPTAGKLAEEFGPRRVFFAGILLVLLGGVVGGIGQNLTMLITARVLIGIGTSAGYPSAMVLVRRRAESAGLAAPPGGVLGGLAIAGMATAAVGPPVGGVLVGWLGWHSAFLINVPLTLGALAMTARWIPRDRPAEGPRRAREVAARVDVLGIVGFAATMTALLVFVMALPKVGWAALALVLAVPLVWWELRTPTPFFDIRGLVANGALARTYLRTALTLLGSYTVMYGVTQWLEAARGMSTEGAGLFLLPMGAMSAFVSWPLSRRNLVRGPLIVAGGSMLVASIGILFVDVRSPAILLVAVMLVFGVTIGTTSVGNQTAVYTQAPADQIGTASGLFRTSGYLGSIASATVTGVIFKDDVTDSGLHTLAAVLVAAGAVVLAMTLLDRRLRRPAERPNPKVRAPAR